jgi:16S rRNA A1518/A1519 N6-dimethyltransferase RsmA/KsgA/DIM1 with predicted DNA glycosylase/AP lyase activity
MKKDVIAQALAEAGLKKTVRAEKMTMEDFATLSEILEK